MRYSWLALALLAGCSPSPQALEPEPVDVEPEEPAEPTNGGGGDDRRYALEVPQDLVPSTS
jgi:hypothetical protein